MLRIRNTVCSLRHINQPYLFVLSSFLKFQIVSCFFPRLFLVGTVVQKELPLT